MSGINTNLNPAQSLTSIGYRGISPFSAGVTPTPPEVRTYATWNPADKNADITLSNGNLTALSSNQWRAARTTISKSSGKWYWEVSNNNGGEILFGIGKSNASLGGGGGGDFLGRDGNSYSWYSGTDSNGYKFPPDWTPYGAPSMKNAGDVVGIAMDLDAGTLEFFANGVSRGVAFTGISGTYFPMFSMQPGSATTANFGATPFAYTVPTGYNAGLYSVPIPVPPGAVFATWNPADKASDITLSSGNLLASQPNLHWSFVRSTIGKSSGKWYWETTVGTGTHNQIGVQDSAGNVNTDIAGVTPVGCSYNMADGGKVVNGTSGTYGSPFANGYIIGTALDMDAGTIQFYKNGVAQPVITGLSGTQFAANSLYQNSTSLVNFGATPFAYPVPTGYNEGLYDTVDLSAGLVAHYPLATNSLDTSGNGYDGVDTNVTYSSGSAVFTTSSFISTISGGFGVTGDYTLNAWIKTSGVSNEACIFGKDVTGSRDFQFRVNSNGTIQHFRGDGGAGVISDYPSVSTVTNDVWRMITATFSTSTGGQILIDGTVNATNGTTTGNAWSNALMQLSARGDNYTNYVGAIKKARIYNRVLNAGEIAALYAEGYIPPTSVSWNNGGGYIPEMQGASDTGLKLKGNNSFTGCTGVTIVSAGGGVCSTPTIDGSGQLVFNYTAPFVDPDILQITGTDYNGNPISINFSVPLPW